METFFRKHFQQKTPGPREGQRRPSGVGLPTGKARRRSPAGQASSSLAQRRRSSAQLQGCLPVCGLGAQGASCRRRSSTAPPTRNPRFVVEEVPTLRASTVGAQCPGAPPLLAGLVGMEEEKEEEGVLAGEAVAGPSSSTQTGPGVPEPPMLQGRGPLLPMPPCLRRASTHLLPTDVVYGHTFWGLHGHYGRLSQRWPMGPLPPARVRPLSRRRQVALRRKVAAGPQAWSTLLV